MTGRGSFDILACQTCDSSDNTGDPRVTDCHLFSAISLSLFDFGHCDSAQVLFTVRRVRRLFLLFQIQIREIARRTVTLRLENWRTRNPTDHSSIDLKYLMRNPGCRRKVITLHLRALRKLIRTGIGLRRGYRRRW